MVPAASATSAVGWSSPPAIVVTGVITHRAVVVAVHGASVCDAVIATLRVPPSAGALQLVGVTVNVTGACAMASSGNNSTPSVKRAEPSAIPREHHI
jgi:hypothetical protein